MAAIQINSSTQLNLNQLSDESAVPRVNSFNDLPVDVLTLILRHSALRDVKRFRWLNRRCREASNHVLRIAPKAYNLKKLFAQCLPRGTVHSIPLPQLLYATTALPVLHLYFDNLRFANMSEAGDFFASIRKYNNFAKAITYLSFNNDAFLSPRCRALLAEKNIPYTVGAKEQ